MGQLFIGVPLNYSLEKYLDIPTKMQLQDNINFGTDAAASPQLYNNGLNRRCIAGDFPEFS